MQYWGTGQLPPGAGRGGGWCVGDVSACPGGKRAGPHRAHKFGVDTEHKKIGGSIRGTYRTETYSNTVIKGTNVRLQNSPFLVLNMNLFYYPLKNHNLKIYATVENLLNQNYYHVYFGNEEGFMQTPQDPIRLLGGVSYAF